MANGDQQSQEARQRAALQKSISALDSANTALDVAKDFGQIGIESVVDNVERGAIGFVGNTIGGVFEATEIAAAYASGDFDQALVETGGLIGATIGDALSSGFPATRGAGLVAKATLGQTLSYYGEQIGEEIVAEVVLRDTMPIDRVQGNPVRTAVFNDPLPGGKTFIGDLIAIAPTLSSETPEDQFNAHADSIEAGGVDGPQGGAPSVSPNPADHPDNYASTYTDRDDEGTGVSGGASDNDFDTESFGDDGIEGMDDAFPIVMDMDGDGVEIAGVDESTAMFDLNGDGFRNLSAWATGGDGLLAFDRDSDGQITDQSEIAFIGYEEGAASDLEGLRAFDTNDDGYLDAGDDQWSQFGVWIDANQDGISDVGEFQSLDQHGIERVSLTSDSQQQELSDGSQILGTTHFELNTGESLAAADAVLRFTEAGYRTTDSGYSELGSSSDGTIGVADNDNGLTLNLADAGLEGFVAGDGDDVLTTGDSQGSVINARGGDDIVYGSHGDDWIAGGTGADVIETGDGNDVIFFDAADILAGAIDAGDGFDIGLVEGSIGVDVDAGLLNLEAIVGSVETDVLTAGTALDVYFGGGAGDDQLTGGDGDDILDGGSGSDVLEGGAGDDILLVDSSDQNVSGGAGIDAVVATGINGVTLDLGAGSVEIALGNVGDDVLDARTVETFALLDGGAGNDQLFGSQGDDLLDGGAGSDLIHGGAGFDAATYAGFLEDHLIDIDVVNGGVSIANVISGDTDSVTDVEALTFADAVVRLGNTIIDSASAGTVSGTSADELFAGSDGADVITAQSGDDLLLGDGGNDQLHGEAGRDYLDGGQGDDMMSGGADNDILFGRDGNDQIDGNAGNDRLHGGDGDDVLGGDEGNDMIFAGSGHDKAYGGAGNDVVNGGDGDDRVFGSEGDDIITGGAGTDYVKGGTGSDTFVFNAGDGQDMFGIYAPDWRTDSDRVVFGEGIDHRNLWLSFDADHDLVFDVIGTDDQVSLGNWTKGPWCRPETIETVSGFSIDEASIHQLVSAMAQFSNGAPDAALLDDPDVRAELDQAIAAAWQPKDVA